MKLNFATPFCKCCFKDITSFGPSSLFEEKNILCETCFREMEPNLMHFKIGEFKAISCYYYNEKIREMIYRLKGCFDIEMADLFLVNQKRYFSLLFHSYYLVPAPSFKEKDEIRGFNHVGEIFRGIGKGYIHAIIKTDNVKQADLNFKERQEIGNHLAMAKNINLDGKKILFVDDLITTGATAKSCCDLLKKAGAKDVRILSVARTRDVNERKGRERFHCLP